MTYVSSLLRPLCRGKKKKVSLLLYRLTVRAKKKERDNLRNLCCEDDPLKIKT